MVDENLDQTEVVDKAPEKVADEEDTTDMSEDSEEE